MESEEGRERLRKVKERMKRRGDRSQKHGLAERPMSGTPGEGHREVCSTQRGYKTFSGAGSACFNYPRCYSGGSNTADGKRRPIDHCKSIILQGRLWYQEKKETIENRYGTKSQTDIDDAKKDLETVPLALIFRF